MVQLNLPPANLIISCEDGNKQLVFDPIRKKRVAFTPEEHVRQSFVQYLVGHKQYPISHIANEQAINLNGLSRRCDSVVYDKDGNPKVIIEYKAPSVSISAKTFAQISRYNLVLKVDYLIVSNGLKHYCVKMDYASQSYTFLTDIPDYTSL